VRVSIDFVCAGGVNLYDGPCSCIIIEWFRRANIPLDSLRAGDELDILITPRRKRRRMARREGLVAMR
jgi:hypothetical protein